MNPQQRLRGFRRLALAGAMLAAVVVVLGAWVRLTDAGLGCPDWPGCYGHVYPQAGDGLTAPGGFQFGKAIHEMIHRYFAGTLGVIIVALLLWAIWNRKIRGQPLIPAALLLVVVCLQGALGAFTVTMLLKPLIVTAHLLGGLTTLGLLWWLSLTPAPHSSTQSERGLRKFAIVGVIALVLQIALGGWTSTNYAAVACPDFPTCQGSWWPAMDYRHAFVLWRGLGINYEGGVLANSARVAIHFTHRLGAIVAAAILLSLGISSIRRGGGGRVSMAGYLVVLGVLLQICIGVAMVHFGVPLVIATMHNAGAAFLVIGMTTLLRSLWPAAAGTAPAGTTVFVDMVPLRHADASR